MHLYIWKYKTKDPAEEAGMKVGEGTNHITTITARAVCWRAEQEEATAAWWSFCWNYCTYCSTLPLKRLPCCLRWAKRPLVCWTVLFSRGLVVGICRTGSFSWCQQQVLSQPNGFNLLRESPAGGEVCGIKNVWTPREMLFFLYCCFISIFSAE